LPAWLCGVSGCPGPGGRLWHILAEVLTKDGVPFFWLFSDKRRHTFPEWDCSVRRVLLSIMAAGGIILLIYLQIPVYFE
jgi:membrane-bound metal-dependent hydrolase YbcI (DUF457 family)